MIRAVALALCLAPLSAAAQDRPAEIEVDLELLLAVDVSRSMSPAELEIQRRGYVEALRSNEVIAAITGGMTGRIALAYVEWAGEGAQRVLVDWTLIETREDALAFATLLDQRSGGSMRRTSIADAVDFGRLWFVGNGFQSWRQVIDVSGDGPNNQGRPVTEARDAAIADGITINGLPLMTDDGMERGLGLQGSFSIPDLDLYYLNCVVGGPGAFVLPVLDWSQFAAAVRRKLVLEIAATEAGPLIPVQMTVPDEGYDCLIGERIWNRARRDGELR